MTMTAYDVTNMPAPAPCIEINHMPSIEETSIKVHRVPLVVATQKNIKSYGRLVDNYDQEEVIIETWPTSGWRPVEAGTGNQGGIHEGDFLFYRQGGLQIARNLAVDGHYITGWFEDPAIASVDRKPDNFETVYVREANYHPDGGQVFFPTSKAPFIALLAPATIGDDIKPEDFTAFFFDGSYGLQIWPGTWHQPLYPLQSESRFIDKQSKVHACIACDTVKEFGCYLAFDLRDPRDQ